MKYLISSLLLIILSTGLSAQMDCEETFTMKVTAPSGLNMREQPQTDAKVMLTIPYNNILIACASTSGKLTVGKTMGYWRQVLYEGKLGYVFDAYLELVDPELRKAMDPKPKDQVSITQTIKVPEVKQAEESKVEEKKPVVAAEEVKEPVVAVKEPKPEYSLVLEAYNYCGQVEKINPGILWYGFYPANTDAGETEMQVKPVDIEVLLSKSRSSEGLEFDIRTDRQERSLFMIGSTMPLDLNKMDLTDRSDLMRYSNQKIFPGQQLNIDFGDKVASLSATGGISSTGDCPELQNYKLSLSAGKTTDLMSLLPKGQCGLPEIYWIGDLNGDQLPDFIVVSIFEDRSVFSLLVSGDGGSMSKSTQWSIEKCNN